jgi:hypothetical protein
MQSFVDTTPHAQAGFFGPAECAWSHGSGAPRPRFVRGGVCPHGAAVKVGATDLGMPVDGKGIRRRPPAP